MQVPPFVRRATLRLIAGGVTLAVVTGAIGLVRERLRFGERSRRRPAPRSSATSGSGSRRSNPASKPRSSSYARDSAVAVISQTRDQARTRQVFERLAAVEEALQIPEVAITVYGLEARPFGWVGRPATLPIGRITGPDALFLAESPLGLRLTRVAPVLDLQDAARRVATLVVEAPLPGTSRLPDSPEGFEISTSVVPVPLRLGFEAARTAGGVVISGPSGEPLAVVEVPADEIRAARELQRQRRWAVALAVLCVVLLLLTGPLLDWRRLVRTVPGHIGLTVVLLALLVAARAIAWQAVRLAGLSAVPLVPTGERDPAYLLLASASDFFLTALLIAGVVGLLASSFEQWRQSRRLAVRVVPSSRVFDLVAFVGAQVLAGAGIGASARGIRTIPAHASGADAVRPAPLLAQPVRLAAARGRDRPRHPARGAPGVCGARLPAGACRRS